MIAPISLTRRSADRPAQVNRSYRNVALTKQLWIVLLRDLEWRGLLDRPLERNLQTFNTSELIDEVKRVVVGPKTWAVTSADPPTLSRQVLVPFEHPENPRGSDIILPGGRYFAMGGDHTQNLGIWEVATGQCVWNGPSNVGSPAFQMIEGGNGVYVIFTASVGLYVYH